MLQAVRAGVFVAVYASCILRLLASVLQAASPIISRVSFDKNEANIASGAPGNARNSAKDQRLAPKSPLRKSAARRDAPELKPAPLPHRRRAPDADAARAQNKKR